MKKETIVINDKIIIEYDGRLYRVFKEGELVGYSDVLQEAKEYAQHYVND